MSVRVACAVLAAGASERLGYPKQLTMHCGVPLVRWAALCATREGIARSIRTAVLWAQSCESAGLLLVLCDQPRLTAQHLSRLIQCFERSCLKVASRYAGKNAVPAIFPRADFSELTALQGDFGAGRLLNGGALLVDVTWPDGAFDVDTAEDAAALLVAETPRPARVSQS